MKNGNHKDSYRSQAEFEPGCIFCEELLEQTEGLVTETDYWRVLVSRDQGYLGRCLVIPRRHVETRQELTEEEVLELHYLQIDLENAVTKAFGARICNWTQLGNDAFAEAEPKPHLHHHMRPRYQRPVEFGGYMFTDDNFGQMYDLEQRWNVDKDLATAGFKNLVAESIGRYFNQG